MKKMSILDAVVAGFLGGMIDGCTKKRRKRNCPYSYQYASKKRQSKIGHQYNIKKRRKF